MRRKRSITINDINKYIKEKVLKLEGSNISKLKENLVLYRGHSKSKYNINPSIIRELANIKFETSCEFNYYKEIGENHFFSKKNEDDINLSFLARCQHYGYGSRLIDVTYNKLKAIYFACNSNFGSKGKIYTFVHKKNAKKNAVSMKYYFYYNQDADTNTLKNISRKMILLSEKFNKTNDYNSIEKFEKYIKQEEDQENLSLVKQHITEPVLIIEKNEFSGKNTAEDIRYDAQNGLFILFGNKLIGDEITKEINNPLDKTDDYELIEAKDKVSLLYKLAEENINFTSIYPDTEKTHKINRIVLKIKRMNKIGNVLFFPKDCSLKEYSVIFNKEKLIRLAKKLIGESKQNVLKFILSDVFTILKNAKDGKDAEDVKEGKDFIKQLNGSKELTEIYNIINEEIINIEEVNEKVNNLQ